jgi:2-polyprenyl-3-methyl-5-hydroxy-6-metoxy-1,4-benzoquinol methylase
MQPSEIAESYDSIAHQWLEPHLETNGIRQHELALKFRSGGGTALDVGSGCNGRFIRLLESRGYEVEGLDVSAQMIALAKTRNPHVTFYHADVCEWMPAKQYDFISAWDSIWHVPLDRSESVLRKLCGALTPGGILIWTTAGLDGPEEKRDSTMGPPVYYSVLGIPKTLRTITDAGCVCRHLEYDQLPEKHVFLIAQKA